MGIRIVEPKFEFHIYECDECLKPMKQDGMIINWNSTPQKYPHHCTVCGYKIDLDKVYPHLRCVNFDKAYNGRT